MKAIVKSAHKQKKATARARKIKRLNNLMKRNAKGEGWQGRRYMNNVYKKKHKLTMQGWTV